MRPIPAALAVPTVALLAASTPAAAQYCECGYGAPAYVETGPAYVVVPRTTYVPHTRYRRETVLVPHTHLVPRVIYEPRTSYVPRTVEVPTVAYSRHTSYSTYPAHGGGYPSGYRYGGPTYVPPGTSYGCLMGTVGCDSSAVGPIEY